MQCFFVFFCTVSYVFRKASEIMDMEHNSPAKERHYERREKTTNLLDPPTNFRTGAVNPEAT